MRRSALLAITASGAAKAGCRTAVAARSMAGSRAAGMISLARMGASWGAIHATRRHGGGRR
jgi:hypothetical protein